MRSAAPPAGARPCSACMGCNPRPGHAAAARLHQRRQQRQLILPLQRSRPALVVRAAGQQAGVRPPSPPPNVGRFRRSIWTAIDVAALLGSVGGALAALLGVVSPTYALALPLVLPVVSLIAALQREDVSTEVSHPRIPPRQAACTITHGAATPAAAWPAAWWTARACSGQPGALRLGHGRAACVQPCACTA